MTSVFQYSALRVFAILTAVFLAALPLKAHENTPAIIDATPTATDLTFTIKLNLESILAGTAANHESGADEDGADEYNALRALSKTALQDRFTTFEPTFTNALDLTLNGRPAPLTLRSVLVPETGDTAIARTSTLTFTTPLNADDTTLTWHYPKEYGDSILRFFKPDTPDALLADFVAAGTTATVDLSKLAPQTTLEVVTDYIIAGFDHIIPKGLDHILFVIGLFLLSAKLRPLLTQVTMFTLAHTITLALGALGYITIPASIVEPLIAASIVFIAVENLFTQKLSPWRPYVIFGFGLLHGLGFASVLGDFGLPTAQFVPALIAFNIGVELGQLCVIALCFLAVGLWFRNRSWYHAAIIAPASVAIAIIAAYWFFERVGLIA